MSLSLFICLFFVAGNKLLHAGEDGNTAVEGGGRYESEGADCDACAAIDYPTPSTNYTYIMAGSHRIGADAKVMLP